MKHNRNPLASAIHYALGAGVALGLAATAAPVWSQEAEEEEAIADRIVVTGSRIARVDLDGALPVTVIDRDAIELSGESSVAELLRNTTLNTFGSFRPQSGSSAQSFAGVSLRGLGEDRTVVLIDGRRAPRGTQVGGANDLNLIPLAAVERIEILSDGASAIYGADAIGGVVNIITRKDYEGVQLRYTWTNPKREGGKVRDGSVLWGTSGAQGRVLAGFSKSSRGMIFSRDREWSAEPGASSFANNYGIPGFDDDGNAIPAFAFLNPGSIAAYNDGVGCEDIGRGFYDASDIFAVPPGFRCFYDFNLVAANEASTNNRSVFVNGDFEINSDWRIVANAFHTQVRSFGRYAPTPEAIFLPEGAAANLTGQPVFLWHRFAAVGPRDSFVESNNSDVMVALQGGFGDVDVEVGVRHNRNAYTDRGYNYISIPIAQQFLIDGTYDPFRPFDNDQSVLDAMNITIGRDGFYNMDELFVLANGDFAELSGGPIGWSLGAEWRREDYADIYDAQSAAGNVGGSAGNSAFGDRIARAVYGELLFPVLDNFEISLAGRFDDYSDFSAEFSPKIALRYQPINALAFRGSWGQGYRAPTLDIANQQPAFSASFINHPPSCLALGLPANCTSQTRAFTIANPDIEAETSDQWSVGMFFQPTDWLEGSIDYYNITVDNRIAFFGAGAVIAREEAGLPLPAGLFSTRTPDNQIVQVFQGFDNEGKIETDGVDLNVRANFDLAGGRLFTGLSVSYVNSFKIDGGQDLTGVDLSAGPRWRSSLQSTYSWGDFQFGYVLQYIHKMSQRIFQGERQGHVATSVRHDLQFTYFTPFNSEVTLGVRNLTDRDPSLNPFQSRDFNFGLYDAAGRVPYIRFTQNF